METLKSCKRNGEDRASVLVYFKGAGGYSLDVLSIYFLKELQILKGSQGPKGLISS